MTVEAHKVEIYKDEADEWRWRAKDTNGEIVAESGEGYKNRSYTEQAVMDLFQNAIIEGDWVDES